MLSTYVRRASARTGLTALYHGLGAPTSRPPPAMERHGSSPLPPFPSDLPSPAPDITPKLRLPIEFQIATLGFFRLSGPPQRRYFSTSHGASSGPRQYKPKKKTVHALPTMDLTTFLLRNPPIVHVTLPGDSTRTAMVPDIVARAFSSAGVRLEQNERDGISFMHPLDPSMLRVDVHGYIQIAPGTWIKDSTEASAYLDKYYLGQLFNHYLSEACGGNRLLIPGDWRHLLDRMLGMGQCQGYRFLVDPAFLGTSVWPYSYMDTFQFLEELQVLFPHEHAQVVNRIPMPAGGWDVEIKQSALPSLYFLNRGMDKSGALIPTKRSANDEEQRGKYYRNSISHAKDYTRYMKYSTLELHMSLRAKGGGEHLAQMIQAVHAREKATIPWKPMLSELRTERHLCHDFAPCCPMPRGCLRKILSQTPVPGATWAAVSAANADKSLVCADVAGLDVNFSIDQWKLFYEKTTDKNDLIEGFLRLFNPKETSLWFSNCSGGKAFKEARSKVVGLTYQLRLLGKDYAFGKVVIVGSRPFKIRGVWLFKGLRIPDFVQKGPYISQLEWREVNLADPSDKELLEGLIAEQGSFASSIVYRQHVS